MGAAKDLIDTLGIEVVRELVAAFLVDAPMLLGRMRTAAAAGDREGVRVAGHTLSSTARIFGLEELADLCKAIEKDPGTPRVDDAERLFAAAKLELAALG